MTLYGFHCQGKGIRTETFSVTSKFLFKTKEDAENYREEFLRLCLEDNLENGTEKIELREYILNN